MKIFLASLIVAAIACGYAPSQDTPKALPQSGPPQAPAGQATQQAVANSEAAKTSPAAAAAMAKVGHTYTAQELAQLVQNGQASRCAVVTAPPGAGVYIDGSKGGVSPLAFFLLKQGDTPRTITIKMAGYKTVEKQFIPDGKTIPIGLTLESDSLVTRAKAGARDMTLAEFRNSYLNQRILILQGHDIGGSLGGWQPVKQAKDGSFQIDFGKSAFISFKYMDQTPTIIAIRESSGGGTLLSKGGQKNAMGEKLTDDDIVNPYVDVFVRFDDGQLAKYTSFVSLIRDRSAKNLNQDPDSWEMQLLPVSVRDAHAEIVARNLSNAMGQKVYAVHDSLLFGRDITTVELLDIRSRLTKRIQDVPLLTPMTIVAAKYNDRYDLIVWKLQLADGREIISAARYRDEDLSEIGNDNSFLGRSIGRLLLRIPSNLTSEELAAISARKIFRGMSQQAVFYSWGVTNENDYGRGGRQLVYGENQFVYLDNSGKVTDWQSLDR
jgi:PEGA domain